MFELANNKLKNSICKLTYYLDKILNNMIGYYIDKRKGNRSPILVIYLRLTPEVVMIPGLIIRRDKRGMLKIPRKCLIEFIRYIEKIRNLKLYEIIEKILHEKG